MIQQQSIADAEREESWRNGLYANRQSIMAENAEEERSSMCSEHFDEGYEYETFGKPRTKVGKLKQKLRRKKKKEEEDPYAATYDQNNGAMDIASSAVQYLAPVLRQSLSRKGGGPPDPRLDDTGVNR